jgi:lysophospholipase L1-like esterase
MLARLAALSTAASLVACASVPVVDPSPPIERATGPAPLRTDALPPAGSALVQPEQPHATTPPAVPELARFHAALRALADKKAEGHVRILWLGDSHGQADFWSGQLRKSLAQRFGYGGPGFLHLGYKNYRHDGVKLTIDGRWRMRPKRPVWIERQDDGVFGLGGLMMSGYADSPRVELHLTEPAGSGELAYDVCYRFHKPDDQLEITLGAERRTIKVGPESPVNALRHISMTGSSSTTLAVRPIGRTDLCGATVEAAPGENPGVVLDTLAINGARYGTMLAWDAEGWIAEVARRRPSLVVFELGTNEAGDGNPKFAKVADDLTSLLGRVRQAAPESDCVVVSPTDRADAEERSAKMRDALLARAQELGCSWFDAWQTLGGQGAMAKLRDEADPLVQPDGIHLTIKGYRELGTAMYTELMRGYGAPAK